LAQTADTHPGVVLWARSEHSADKARERLGDHVDVVTDISELADSSLVIEAVVEDMDVKRNILGELGELLGPEALIASTTSSLSVTELGAASGRPDRFAGIHVFNPVPKMKLVELAFPPEASDETRSRARALCESLGKEPVEVGLQNEKGYPHVGVLDFADVSLSTSTGTIALRGIFKNEETTLYPGLFARVRLPMGGPRPMLVIPGSAIGSDQQGDYVYVVGADNVVARRSIVRGPITDRGFAIRSGLRKDDRVIVNGILNARAGEKVAPAEATPVPASAASKP